MFLATMTDKEILKEVRRDMPQLNERSDSHWKREMRRRVAKTTHFPCVETIEVKTKSHNHYILTISVFSKREYKHNVTCMGVAAIIPKDKEPMVICLSSYESGECVERYYAHFFRRYRERMGVDGTFTDLVKRYMKTNVCIAPKLLNIDDEGVRFCLCTEEGVSYGVINHQRQWNVKTFIPTGMLGTYKKEFNAKGLADVEDMRTKMLRGEEPLPRSLPFELLS